MRGALWDKKTRGGLWDNHRVEVDESAVVTALRLAGARFALVHGSRVDETTSPGRSDLDVGAWWPDDPPASWEVDVPGYVDLVVLNDAPLWLAGRVAQHGRVLFEDDPRARVAWQADTRLRYLDEMPAVGQRHATRLRQLARLGHEGSASEHG